MMEKYTLRDPKKRKYHRDSTLSNAEVMVIIILFHNSGYRCLKHFYLEYVSKHLRHLFPELVSHETKEQHERRSDDHVGQAIDKEESHYRDR